MSQGHGPKAEQVLAGRPYWRGWVEFTARLLAIASLPAAYNPAVREVLARQIYFTAWEVLWGLCAFSVVLTGLVAHIVAQVALPYGMQSAAAELLLRILSLETLPLLVALFLALRSGAAMNAEMALMSERGELASWQRLGLDPIVLECMPRLVGGVVSLLVMTLLCVGVSVVTLWFSVTFATVWQLPGGELRWLLARTLSPMGLAGLVLQCIAFGIIITTLPVYEGMRTPRQPHMVPVAVLRGMVRVFVGLMAVWLVVLALRYG